MDRTCRKVGAHRKGAQGKANRTPAQVEYDRGYNRLKQRKNRGKVSVAERGELANDEVHQRFAEF